MQNNLLISIDPGFDSMKVVANGRVFKFPFNAVSTDERKINDYGIRNGLILYKDETGATWRVGKYARGLIHESKGHEDLDSKMRDFYTEERFTSHEFLIGVRAAIALSIEKAGMYRTHGNADIHVILALPHGIRAKYSPIVTSAVIGEHAYYMTFDNDQERLYRYTIAEKNVITISQTVAAILGETSNSNGEINHEKYFLLSNGPTLVIDGGYYTIGMVPVARGGSVDDTKAESETQHSMKNVNMAVSREIADVRPDIKHYSVEYLINQDESVIRYLDKNGKVQAFDLKGIRSEKIEEVCTGLIQYLNKKYNNLLDFKYILVTGGTGACYFPQLLAYYSELGLADAEHMLLTHPEINGKPVSIEFSIAVGAFKGLSARIRALQQ